ncbi:MAG TPA: hypothetical protein VL485_13105 [Ktedonobacteraceae bacterium]|nr:hypothetical protein [Ktedonobacteraceae bacterium]
MRFCPNCGTAAAADRSICPNCGTTLPAEQPAANQYAGTIGSAPYPQSGGAPMTPQSGSYMPTVLAGPSTPNQPGSGPYGPSTGPGAPGYNVTGPSGSNPAYGVPATPNVPGVPPGYNPASPFGSNPAYGTPSAPGYNTANPYGSSTAPATPGYNVTGPSGSNPYGAPAGQAYPPVPPGGLPAQGEFYGQMMPPPPPNIGAGAQPPVWATPQYTPKKKTSRGLFITLSLITAVVVLGSFWLIYYAGVARPAAQHAQATADAQSSATASANAAQAQATATQVQATAAVQATVTAEQTIYKQATAGAPTFSSPLTAQDNSKWDLYTAEGGGGCAFTNNALHASVDRTDYYVPCFALNSSFSDFAFQVQMTIVKGDEGGLLFRGNSTASQYYLFRIGQNGSYGLYLSQDDTHSSTLASATSTDIKKGVGQVNLLTVIAKGNDIYLYVNQQYITHVTDASYAKGQLGVFGSNGGNPTDAAFSNAQVWQL